ncbi:YsnF/AvaK domain-containing protein [Nafulsella turpanensis]|uniref:YsnF/AvaK domain-containing protein n=1 Tax=Nafulsella turpanensis TaxID=1265690 RepID=UPI0003484672|nr:YsnF/AvaK domain-containing protein [Nafulsella turpanensis]
MKQTVIGVYENEMKAREAKKMLEKEGFKKEDIDISPRIEGDVADRNHEHVDNFFSSMFEDTNEARNYSEVARRGSVVTVHTTSMDRAERAAAILDENGAIDANEHARKYKKTDDVKGTDKKSIPVIEEELEVGKKEVETGGVRLRSRIVERPVEEKLRLREEHVEVERKPVDRKATEADFKNFEEGTIEATERAEVPVVGKEARVVEEVKLKKEVNERKETVRDRVRHTEVEEEKVKADKKRKDERV